MGFEDDLAADIRDLTRGNGLTVAKMRNKPRLVSALTESREPDLAVEVLASLVGELEDHDEQAALRNALGLGWDLKGRPTLDRRRQQKEAELGASRNTLIKRETAAIRNVVTVMAGRLTPERLEEVDPLPEVKRPVPLEPIFEAVRIDEELSKVYPSRPHEAVFIENLTDRELLERIDRRLSSIESILVRLIGIEERFAEGIEQQVIPKLDDLSKKKRRF